ncbi:MAG TPA: hypothetical protein VGO62_20855, partial [Myxococcota bacterium]
MKARDKERVLAELRSRLVDEVVKQGKLEDTILDAIYFEKRRLKEDRSSSRDSELHFWGGVRDELKRANERTQIEMLKRVVDRYAEEICGQFDERVYDAVTRAGEPVLGLLLNAVSPKKILAELPHLPHFDSAVVLQ